MRRLIGLLSAVLALDYTPYDGTCHELPNDRWYVQLTTSWGGFSVGGEQPKISFDFDNNNKFENLVMNAETYLLVEFDVNVNGLNLQAYYPGGKGAQDQWHDGRGINSNGCPSCCNLCSATGGAGNNNNCCHQDGQGYTASNVMYLEVDDDAGGGDLTLENSSGGNPWIEFQWTWSGGNYPNLFDGSKAYQHIVAIHVCQGASPTQTGIADNWNNPGINGMVPLSINDNFVRTNIFMPNNRVTVERSMVVQMAFKSSDVDLFDGDYIEAQFDGQFHAFDVISGVHSHTTQPDGNYNIYRFYVNGDWIVSGRTAENRTGIDGWSKSGGGHEWYMNLHMYFYGSDWHVPNLVWCNVVRSSPTEAPETTPAATTPVATTPAATTPAATTPAPTTPAATTPAPTTTPPTTTTTAPPTPTLPTLIVGTCWSGNWSLYMNLDDPVSDAEDRELFEDWNGCAEIAAVQVRDQADPEGNPNQTLIMDPQVGSVCRDVDNMPEGCVDYEVRFCCEGCCPYLNVSGDPQLTDYYENYPGIYKLQDDLFNDMITYKQIAGYEAGQIVYGQGIIYYWEDVGWLLGANTFTYSYYSDGIGDRCPQFAPWNWTNEVYGTQLFVECKPIFPSCNDVDCVENAYCQMLEDGPECICEPEYEEHEDGQCLKPENETVITDGHCNDNDTWTDWLNSDTPSGAGDWEMLSGFAQSMVCENPKGIEARRIDGSHSTPLITHISKEVGFWCYNADQDGVACADFEVRFCCAKWSDGSDCSEEGYEWSAFLNRDTPDGIGDMETTSFFGEFDVCSNPIGVEAQMAAGSVGESGVTHIDANVGFWCLNEENNGNCADFEARFCCPSLVDPDENGTVFVMDGTCDDPDYYWTKWLNTDSPIGSDGDYETLAKMARMNVCESPSGIQAKTEGPGATDNFHIHKESGFWCINDENPSDCADFEVRFCCPKYKTGECDDEGHTWTGWYNDEWNKKNERLWVSNQDELELLQPYGDGAACANPTESEIRVRPTGSTSFQSDIWEYSTHLVQHLSPTGYRCYNEEQGEFDTEGLRYRCVDMEIRFCCPNNLQAGECDQPGYEWSDWLNKDSPDEDGDWETVSRYSASEACANPIAVQANPTDSGSTDYTHIDVEMGFYCINEEQGFGGLCADFEVRFCCPKTQVGECNKKGYEWTPWLDRDDPDGTGDWESLHAFEPNQACVEPIAAKAMDNLVGISGNSDSVTHLDLSGFYCLNDEQPNGLPCSDFSVSFCCPVDEDVTCETAQCDGNEWCLETDEGPVCNCGDDDFTDDWDDADFTRGEDGECLPIESPLVNGTIMAGECGTFGYEWTHPMSKDTPDGDGDFEFFHMYTIEEACANPTGIRATCPGYGASNRYLAGMDNIQELYFFTNPTPTVSPASGWPVHIDMERGFWCVNSEQAETGLCKDFVVEFCCPKAATGDCSEDGYEWSTWYNNDNPEDSGDWELRTDNMCANPIAVKAETMSGNAMNAMTHIDNDIGFWCLNDENGPAGCEDYRVSFCCPGSSEGSCDAYGHSWGSWLDIDDPDGSGDMEIKTSFSEYQVCDEPTGIMAQVYNGTESDAFTRISTQEGFVCENDMFNMCADYEVSWCCPKWGKGNLHCDIKGFEWTSWINKDNPSTSTGDWETLSSYPERVACSNPIGVQAYPASAGSTEVTHIDESLGFWCVNEEQSTGLCADFAVRFCCPQFEQGDCDKEGFEWTKWLDRDDPMDGGDYETLHDYASDQVCSNPIALEAQARSSGSTAVTHVDMEWGFWCANDEQPEGDCADFEVRYCCPKMAELTCEQEGYAWTVWLDSDDPDEDSGDWENKDGFSANVVCATPTAVQAQVKSGSSGSTAVTHLDNDQGFWCINDEQPKDAQCADFEVRFCCPEEYRNPCESVNLRCSENQHIVYETVNVEEVPGGCTERGTIWQIAIDVDGINCEWAGAISFSSISARDSFSITYPPGFVSASNTAAVVSGVGGTNGVGLSAVAGENRIDFSFDDAAYTDSGVVYQFAWQVDNPAVCNGGLDFAGGDMVVNTCIQGSPGETYSECVCTCDEGYLLNTTTNRVDENWTCENTHGTCVRFYKNALSWNDASDYCTSINAELVSVLDNTYQAWLDSMWAGAYWIGLTDSATPNTWAYLNGDDNGFTNWQPGHPLDLDPYNCARVAPDGKWQSGQCTLTNGFFCMIKQEVEQCVEDKTCAASLSECISFDECINKNGDLTVTGQNDTAGEITVKCSDPNAYPANNGGTEGTLKCVCDGKNDCFWESDDFTGELTEDGMCITDHVCPTSMFKLYEGELQMNRNRFINDPTHNTLQSDLYDQSMAEVLGRIETSAIGSEFTGLPVVGGCEDRILYPTVPNTGAIWQIALDVDGINCEWAGAVPFSSISARDSFSITYPPGFVSASNTAAIVSSVGGTDGVGLSAVAGENRIDFSFDAAAYSDSFVLYQFAWHVDNPAVCNGGLDIAGGDMVLNTCIAGDADAAEGADWDWSKGNYLAIIWPNVLPDHVNVCPYGDYYDPYETKFGDGEVQVFETFTNPFVLRDGSDRDLSQNMEVVLNIRHDYDLDVEDIDDLLKFRVAVLPKCWKDDFGDLITKTAAEMSACLNGMLNSQGKVDGSLRMKNKNRLPSLKPGFTDNFPGEEKSKKKPKKNKWKKKPKLSKAEWEAKQAARKARQG